MDQARIQDIRRWILIQSLRAAVACAGLFLIAVITAEFSQAQCPPRYGTIGEQANDALGRSVNGAGDVNTDGIPDFIAGAHLNNAGGPTAGRAYVYSGLSGTLLHVFTGDSAHVRLGSAVDGAGDIDGDGFDDLIVGAPGVGPSSQGAGRVFLFSGQTGDTAYTITGESAGDNFGFAVAGLGDIDGDSLGDFVVGAYNNDGTGTNAGRAYVYSGGTGTLIFTFSGEGDTGWFGYAVGNARDVNGDGINDICIGAPHSDSGSTQAGRAYVFSGTDGTHLHTWTGGNAFDKLGNSIDGIGDVDGDSLSDVIVGAFFDQVNNITGKAYIFSGADGTVIHQFAGEADNDEFGESVAGIPDASGDGIPDVLIGSRYGGPAEAGRAYAFSGSDGTLLGYYEGVTFSDFMGLAVGTVGDIDGDGWPEVIIGSPGRDSLAASAGAAFVVTISPDTDADSLWDACDNCPHVFNPSQADSNGNGAGDVCDGTCACPLQGDPDGSGFVDSADLNQLIQIIFFSDTDVCDPQCPTCRTDLNCDGLPDATDMNVLIGLVFFNGPPPACLAWSADPVAPE